MKKLLSSKSQKHDLAHTVQSFDRKMVFTSTLFALLMLVLVSEGVRLILLNS